MSTSAPRRALAGVIVALILLALGLTVRVVGTAEGGQGFAADSSAGGDAAVVTAPTFPAPGVAHRPATEGPATLHGISVADARAFALLGQVADGTIPALPEVDAETAAALRRMRPVVDDHRPLRGPGKTIKVGGSSIAIAAAPARRDPAAFEPGPAVAEDGGVDRVETIAIPGSVALTDDGHVIDGEGAFAGITLRPGHGPVRIHDRSSGGSCIRLHGDDFGTVRVNGGLVVPGRCYRIDGTVTITADQPVAIDIVPLIAAPEIQDQPWSLPSAPG